MTFESFFILKTFLIFYLRTLKEESRGVSVRFLYGWSSFTTAQLLVDKVTLQTFFPISGNEAYINYVHKLLENGCVSAFYDAVKYT